jgi:uncharacterized damage-inducible protein DinB
LINQLKDEIILNEPVDSGRPFGEIVLHMIRSIEFYSRGLATGQWEPLPYDLKTYETSQKIKTLYEDTVQKARDHIKKLPLSELEETIKDFNRPATKIEILLEMLEHNIQHRGQVLVYLRLLGIKPAKIPYIV